MRSTDHVVEPAVSDLARTALAKGMAALNGQDIVLALRWLERAHRLVPRDANVTLALASASVDRDPARAAELFSGVVARHDVRQGWLGLAAARLRQGGPDAASEAMQAVLSRHAFRPDTAALADQIGGHGGWCGLRSDGRLELHAAVPNRLQVMLDGRPVRGRKLPQYWAACRMIEVRCDGSHLMGSPIQIDVIRRVSGCVETWQGGIRGWAWHPNDPDTAPVLMLSAASGGDCQVITARDESVAVAGTGPLSRPRCFQLTRSELQFASGPIHVYGPDGKDLLGSTLDPFAEQAAYVEQALKIAQAYPAAPPRPANSSVVVSALCADIAVPAGPISPDTELVGATSRRRAATIVIPIQDGGDVVLSCLDSVLASLPKQARILVVDDGSSEPGLIVALDNLVRQRRIALLRHSSALGFPASANAGIQAANGRDVVLLNSDTLVPPTWLDRLSSAAYSAADVGTVTPLSNDASIVSYPGPPGTNPLPDQAMTNRLDRLAERANGAATIDIPVGVGFCLYLRRDCLDACGMFRADLFAQGYGEENDLCLRARRLGWRSVALPGLFVGHVGGSSFGASAIHLRERNGRIVEQLHPGHDALIDGFVAADPLAAARRRIDLMTWQQRGRQWRHAVILITHNHGGGVEQRLARSVETHATAGRRAIVLRPAEAPDNGAAIAVYDGLSNDLPNLVFAVPKQLPVLLRLLRAAKADRVEAHHLADYPPAIYDLIARLRLPYDVHVHDYAWFCPRVSLVAAHDHYCGEPDLQDCIACIADNGHFLKENIGVAELRHRSGAFLAKAQRIIVPAEDTGRRMRRYFPNQKTMTLPHEDDAALRPLVPPGVRQPQPRRSGKASVCVVGAIGVHKGYQVLLACARDAARRNLDLEFVVVGHTIDDVRLIDTERVFVTGRYDQDEAPALIAAQHAQLGFVPSITPETWCLGLSELWRAGLFTAAFDIGAPAERIRRTGHGIVLPLGLSANAINNALVATIRKQGH